MVGAPIPRAPHGGRGAFDEALASTALYADPYPVFRRMRDTACVLERALQLLARDPLRRSRGRATRPPSVGAAHQHLHRPAASARHGGPGCTAEATARILHRLHRSTRPHPPAY